MKRIALFVSFLGFILALEACPDPTLLTTKEGESCL
jgi:hypothetical protein